MSSLEGGSSGNESCVSIACPPTAVAAKRRFAFLFFVAEKRSLASRSNLLRESERPDRLFALEESSGVFLFWERSGVERRLRATSFARSSSSNTISEERFGAVSA